MKNVAIILFTSFLLFAGEYGRITGKVTDKETGEPLIGAKIIVEGTDLEVKTDENGGYIVYYVRAGTYNISCSSLGYVPVTYTNVVINADQTTTLNFLTRPTIIGVTAYVLTAKKPLVVFSQTSSGHTYTSKDIECLPVITINELIKIHPGVVQH